MRWVTFSNGKTMEMIRLSSIDRITVEQGQPGDLSSLKMTISVDGSALHLTGHEAAEFIETFNQTMVEGGKDE